MVTISKYFDLSTAHITKRDSEILANLSLWPRTITHPPAVLPPFPVYTYEYGFFIVPLEDSLKRLEDWEWGLSEDLANLLRHAQVEGCRMICLDRDGDVLPGFPTHDW